MQSPHHGLHGCTLPPSVGATQLKPMSTDSLHCKALGREEKYNWDQPVSNCRLELVAYKNKNHTYRLMCDRAEANLSGIRKTYIRNAWGGLLGGGWLHSFVYLSSPAKSR